MIRNLWPWDGQPTIMDPSTLTDRRNGIIAAWEYLGRMHKTADVDVKFLGTLLLICALVAIVVVSLVVAQLP